MGQEDQAEEIEILESIYPDELEVIDEESISIHLKLETEPARFLRVYVTYGDEYPNVVPKIRIEVAEAAGNDISDGGSETSEDERKYSYDFTPADCQQLLQSATELAEENLGMPMVFSLVSGVKEQAEELYEDRIKDQEAERLRLLSIEEEKEQAKFRGTPVNKQSFAEWRTRFRAEMGWDKPKERPFGRLTGKELFERGLVDDETDEEEE